MYYIQQFWIFFCSFKGCQFIDIVVSELAWTQIVKYIFPQCVITNGTAQFYFAQPCSLVSIYYACIIQLSANMGRSSAQKPQASKASTFCCPKCVWIEQCNPRHSKSAGAPQAFNSYRMPASLVCMYSLTVSQSCVKSCYLSPSVPKILLFHFQFPFCLP